MNMEVTGSTKNPLAAIGARVGLGCTQLELETSMDVQDYVYPTVSTLEQQEIFLRESRHLANLQRVRNAGSEKPHEAYVGLDMDDECRKLLLGCDGFTVGAPSSSDKSTSTCQDVGMRTRRAAAAAAARTASFSVSQHHERSLSLHWDAPSAGDKTVPGTICPMSVGQAHNEEEGEDELLISHGSGPMETIDILPVAHFLARSGARSDAHSASVVPPTSTPKLCLDYQKAVDTINNELEPSFEGIRRVPSAVPDTWSPGVVTSPLQRE